MGSGESAAQCLNCGRDTGPAFCPHCGQESEIRRGPLLEVGREVLEDWLSLDSKLLRSLAALLRPGRLSELYVAGKRAPFLRPFRLYLLASLALFSTALTLEVPADTDFDLWLGGELVGNEAGGEVKTEFSFLGQKKSPPRWLGVVAKERVERARKLPQREIVELIFGGMRRILPLTLILFVPFLALGLKLLYVRGKARRSQYLDHLAFALHFQSASFFAVALTWLVTSSLSAETLASAVACVVVLLSMILVYLPLSLRRFYGQSRRWTAVKTLALIGVYGQLMGLALDISVLVGIWGV